MSILNLNGPAGRSPRGKRAVKVWMGIGLVIAVLGVGSTLASTITINGGTNKEFGQGVQRTVYCGGNKQITVTPVSTYLNVPEPMPNESDSETSRSGSESESPSPSVSDRAGSFYLGGIKVSDIPEACSGVDFVFSAYDQGNSDTSGSPVVISELDSVGISTPTVYWIDSENAYGGVLSASRSEYADASQLMELVVPQKRDKGAFTIYFRDLMGTKHASIDDIARLIIETQNDVIFDVETPGNTPLVTPSTPRL
jgi:hypothetical protein